MNRQRLCKPRPWARFVKRVIHDVGIKNEHNIANYNIF